MSETMMNSLKALLAIESTETEATKEYPFGLGVAKALDYMLNLGKSMGFKTKNCDYYAGYIEFGEGEEMVGILCHLDVVPAGNEWTYPPFDGTEVDGKIYGRGAYDDKGPTITVLYAMKALKDSGFTPQKRIRLILGCNEESGQKCMPYYLAHEETPTVSFSPDADFPVIHGEMGIVILNLKKRFIDRLDDGGIKLHALNGGTAINMVADHAEVVLSNHPTLASILEGYNTTKGTHLTLETTESNTVKITAKGVSAHGSTPEKGQNAISDLIDFLDYVDLEIGDASNFIRFLKHHIGHDLHGENFGIPFKDEFNPLVLNTGVISVNEDEGCVKINIRYPITVSGDAVRDGIEKILEGSGITIDLWKDVPPLYYPKDHPLVTALMKVYIEETGDIEAKPITIGGGTYARSIPNAVAFGALFKDSVDNMHQKDEYITIEELFKLKNIYEKAILALCDLK